MDGSHDVRGGLWAARRLLLGIAALGVSVGCEWLNPAVPHYLSDLVT